MRKFLKNDFLKKYIKSLRFRIFIIVLLVGMIPVFVLKNGILRNFEEQSIRQRGNLVQAQCVNIAGQLADTDYIEKKGSEGIENELNQLANLYNGRIVIVNNAFIIVKDTFGLDENKTIISEEVVKCFQGQDTLNYNESGRFIEMTVPVKNPVTQEMKGMMIVSMPTEDIQDSREALGRQVFLLQAGMLLLIFGIAFYTSRMLVKPFDKVTQSLEEITGGFLEEDLSILDYTETELLSEAYNRMLKRMKSLDDSRQEFVSNVSHELKTPITSMKVLADSLLAQQDVPVELYKEFMGDIAEEIERENKIINDRGISV